MQMTKKIEQATAINETSVTEESHFFEEPASQQIRVLLIFFVGVATESDNLTLPKSLRGG